MQHPKEERHAAWTLERLKSNATEWERGQRVMFSGTKSSSCHIKWTTWPISWVLFIFAAQSAAYDKTFSRGCFPFLKEGFPLRCPVTSFIIWLKHKSPFRSKMSKSVKRQIFSNGSNKSHTSVLCWSLSGLMSGQSCFPNIILYSSIGMTNDSDCTHSTEADTHCQTRCCAFCARPLN